MPRTLPIILLLSVSNIVGTAHADVVPTYDKLDTRLGAVRVVSRRDKSVFEDKITVNGRKVLRSPLFSIGLYESFDLGDRVVILFGANQGGQNPDQLSFLVLKPGRKPRTLSAEKFESVDGTVKSRVKGAEVEVALGYEAKRGKVARLRGEQVTIEYSKVLPPSPMSDESCEWLYEYSAQECLEDTRAYKIDCEEFASGYEGASGVVMSGINALKNHPGFISAALDAVCLRECMIREKPTLQVFKSMVCSIK
jgi:hypothetical protein